MAARIRQAFFVKRHKNDAADAEAICEAVGRPNMRFVAVKSEEQQALALLFRMRDLLVRQRTQTINALRGHMAEYGWLAPKGPSYVALLGDLLEDGLGASLPEAARTMFRMMLGMIEEFDAKIAELDREIAQRSREDAVARRLMTIPGIGPIAATAIAALAPPLEGFARGRDFAAWLGMTPLQKPTGGKQKLGRTSKMGERTIGRLLIIGASAVSGQLDGQRSSGVSHERFCRAAGTVIRRPMQKSRHVREERKDGLSDRPGHDG